MHDKCANRIFALDIGTRTVVGILGDGSPDRDYFEILDVEIMEHTDRNMYDGQIHDVTRVTDVVRRVKEELEERNGCALNHVAIAAAGRSLITRRALAEMNVEGMDAADKAFVNGLELKAMQKAQQEIQGSRKDHSSYYCVGYSVINYYLDNMMIKSLEGHRGTSMGVEVISTFLPRTVVDSLYTVMERAGLEIINLTLEPIAAIRVAIPENLRLLNLAMVDIGAGTSDIAITQAGTITAYSMVAVAGDEITEEIAQRLLTDFNTAERIKLEASKGEGKISYKNALGDESEVDRTQLIDIIRPVVDKLASEIADSIKENNQRAPSAVFCVGGGSLTPGLKESLSRHLGLPVTRVGLKHLEENSTLKLSTADLSGPEMITPVGIALAGYRASDDHFIGVSVNGNNLRMLNTRQMTVSDALLAIGFNPRKLIPSRGEPIKFFVNGEAKEVKGEPGQPARILVNGEEGSLDRPLKNGDIVSVDDAVEGEKARITIKDIVHLESCQVIVAGKRITLPARWNINGVAAPPDRYVLDGDKLEIARIRTLGELIDSCELPRQGCSYKVNGRSADCEYVLSNGDNIEYLMDRPVPEEAGITVRVNGEEVKLPKRPEPYIFVDIFNHIDIDLSRKKGKVELTMNGIKARYTDIISDGDEISISWTRV